MCSKQPVEVTTIVVLNILLIAPSLLMKVVSWKKVIVW
jgi:flagellar biosynthesis protein FliP